MVGFFMCGVLMYVTVTARVRSLVCTSCEAWKARYYFNSKRDISIQKPNGNILIQSEIFQFKNLTAICLYAAR